MNNHLRYIFLAGLFFLNAVSFCQTVKNKLYLLENDEAEKPRILALYQNSNGLILCGTTKGLYRFDGFDFSLYAQDSGIHAAVSSIFETKDKRTLIGFDNGFIGELKNNNISLLTFEEGFPKVAIKSITQDNNGIVWLGTAGEGIYYIKSNRLYNINEDDGLSDSYIYRLLYLPGQGIIAASDRGINICDLRNDKKNISTYTSRNGLPDNIVRCIFLAADNNLWLGMQDAGISAFKKDSGSFTHNDWNYGQVNDLIINGSKIYVATEDSSLLVFSYDKSQSSLKKLYADHTILKPACLLKDREGNIWSAGNNELLRHGKDALEKIFRLTPNESTQVHCLHYSRDSALWFNVSGGLVRLYKSHNEWKSEKFKLPDFSRITITALYEDVADNLWVGSLGKGITIFNHQTNKKQKLNEPLLANSNTICIAGDENIIWISGLEGIVRAKLEYGRYDFTSFNDTAGIGNKYVYNILCDSKKRVWFATDGEGISMLDDNKFNHLKNLKGYTGNVVYKIVEDNLGNIWYATYDKGVIKYDGKKFIAFTTSEGLSDMNISGMVKAGNYIAVICKDVINIIDPATGKINYIDKALSSLDINTDLNAFTSDEDGNIYFVSGNSIYSYTTDSTTIQQPGISIDKVELFLKNDDILNSHVLKYNQNNLSFYFTGIYYSEPERLQYQYKLDGFDKEWVNTKDRVKNFPNLQPGDYIFRVRVSLNRNFVNAAEVSYSFVIEKPFWMQAWFITVLALLIALLLFWLMKLREKNINNLNALKNEKIQYQLETLRNQVNPHFLFNSFNILVSEIENNPDEAVTYVERIADFYRSIIQHREKDLISLEDELSILNNYTFLQEKRFASGLEVRVDIPPEIISTSYIPPLVLQMLVENAIKHNIISKASPLMIDITDAGEDCLAVRNNINKKMQPEKRSGLGLQNIQKRYALLQVKKVAIESDDKFFTVKVPLIKK